MTPSSQPSPVTFMVVDDDEFFLATVVEMLKVLAIEHVLLARNGAQGLKLLNTHDKPVDFILCDVFMPDMDGIEFLGCLADLQFQGGVMVASGVDRQLLELTQTLATDRGLQFLGAFIKPVLLASLSDAMAGARQRVPIQRP